MRKLTISLLLIALIALSVPLVFAGGDNLFIIGNGSTKVDDSGWSCGYVVQASPGTNAYTLQITGTHGISYPLSNIHVVVLINDAAHGDATHPDGLTQIVLSCSKTAFETITTSNPDDFTAGTFNYGCWLGALAATGVSLGAFAVFQTWKKTKKAT